MTLNLVESLVFYNVMIATNSENFIDVCMETGNYCQSSYTNVFKTGPQFSELYLRSFSSQDSQTCPFYQFYGALSSSVNAGFSLPGILQNLRHNSETS